MALSTKLPLFPLSSVLFPGVPIQLHIFEDRYKAMMQHCLRLEQDFGVVLIEEGREALGPIARTHQQGTTAHILKVQPLPEGRMNLVAIGHQRFRILSLDHEGAPYLQGEVELTDDPDASDFENREAAGILPLMQEYIQLLARPDGQDNVDFSRMPRDARALSYAAAYLLHVPQFQKQALLEKSNIPELMESVRELYHKQIELLKAIRDRGLSPPEELSMN